MVKVVWATRDDLREKSQIIFHSENFIETWSKAAKNVQVSQNITSYHVLSNPLWFSRFIFIFTAFWSTLVHADIWDDAAYTALKIALLVDGKSNYEADCTVNAMRSFGASFKLAGVICDPLFIPVLCFLIIALCILCCYYRKRW